MRLSVTVVLLSLAPGCMLDWDVCPNSEDPICGEPGGGAGASADDPNDTGDTGTDPVGGMCLGIDDPGFTDPAKWLVSGDAIVDPTAIGYLGPGEARIRTSGSIQQSACLAAPAPGNSAILRLGVMLDGFQQEDDVPVVSIGGESANLTRVFGENKYEEWAICLGEAAQGDVLVRVASESAIAFDDFRVEEANAEECPPVGEVRNGDFESDTGWETMTTFAEFLAFDMTGRLLRLYPGYWCTNCASATGLLSVPFSETLPAPALSYRVRGYLGPAGTLTSYLFADGTETATLAATNLVSESWQTVQHCIPAGFDGRVAKLQMYVFNQPELGGFDVYIDDVVIVSDPIGCQAAP